MKTFLFSQHFKNKIFSNLKWIPWWSKLIIHCELIIRCLAQCTCHDSAFHYRDTGESLSWSPLHSSQSSFCSSPHFKLEPFWFSIIFPSAFHIKTFPPQNLSVQRVQTVLIFSTKPSCLSKQFYIWLLKNWLSWTKFKHLFAIFFNFQRFISIAYQYSATLDEI